jgi:hypothetical protein
MLDFFAASELTCTESDGTITLNELSSNIVFCLLIATFISEKTWKMINY